MKVILLLVVLVVIFRLALAAIKTTQIKKYKIESILCQVSYLLIILMAMFRGESVGTDTISYIADYSDINIMSMSEVCVAFKGYEGFYILSKLFSLLGLPCYVWFGFIEFVLITSISRFINKYSKDRLYSIILFITTGLFMFSLAGLKQTLALSLILHSYLDLTENKCIRSIFLLIISYFVHAASLIVLVLFVLYLIRNKKIFVPFVIILFFIICFSWLSTASKVLSILGNTHFEMYLEIDRSYKKSTLYLYVLIFLCTVPYVNKYIKSTPMAKVFLCGTLLTCAFQFIASLSPSLFRLALSFLPFFIIYVSNSFSALKYQTIVSKALKACALMGSLVFFIYSNRDFVYSFIRL